MHEWFIWGVSHRLENQDAWVDKFMSWATSNQEQPEKPTPSLKTLERIFEIYDHKYGSKAEWLKAIQFDILRWANGNWKEKVWCSHLIWDQSGWSAHSINKGIIARWVTWEFCPICGAKRPDEGSVRDNAKLLC